MKISATGKSGTIGRHLSAKVEDLGVKLDENSSIQRNIASGTILHFAGIVGEHKVQKDPGLARKVNVDYTIKFAKQVIEHGAKRFIYISSSHVYKSSDEPLHEGSIIEPINRYAEQKLEAEIGLQELFRNFGTEFVIFRVFSILDKGMPKASLGGAIENIHTGIPGQTLMNGDDVRDFLTPKYVAQIIEELSEKVTLPSILNICSSNSYKIIEATRMMLPYLSEAEIGQLVHKGTSKVPVIVGNNGKLREILPERKIGWDPNPYLQKYIANIND